MKILIVCSGNKPNFDFEKIQPFIYDQVNAIMEYESEVKFVYFFIKGRGILGYLKNLGPLKNEINKEKPDLIHAHYSFSGLLANLQRKVGVITTFHGTDVNDFKIRIIARLAYRLSVHSIIVSDRMVDKLLPRNNYSMIPCGVDMDVFSPMDKNQARQNLGLQKDKTYILFSSSFENQIKNFPLAQKAIEILHDENIELLEFKGYNRKEAAMLFNAADVALMTSFSEGSPQFIKEAMACNCPIVATDVGDIKRVISGTEGCYLTSFKPEETAEKLKAALNFNKRTNGRESIGRLSNVVIAKQIVDIYKKKIQVKK